MAHGTRQRQSLALACAMLGCTLGCGPGGAAETIRPADPTAAKALDEAECRDVAKGGEPLVVDWKPEQRGDLEVAMKEGVAVVEYSCKGMRVLPDCRIEGKYGFLGMTKKEQMVRLSNADEVRANLPISGAKIGGELERGSTLDIAMIMVGKSRTTWDAPTREDLKGKCDGATHFVRGATLGAFVMETGTSAKVKAAAEIFGASAGAGSSSEKQTRNADGDPKECAKASPDAAAPPAQCGAAIRLTLLPIAPAPDKDAPPAPPPEKPATATLRETECPAGLVYADGKCTTPASAPAFLCKGTEIAECAEQCDKGHAGSCGNAAMLTLTGGGGASRDAAKAAALFEKACNGDDMPSCAKLGELKLDGNGTSKDPSAAAALFDKACKGGEARGCRMLGRAHQTGTGATEDANKALALYKQACEGGDDVGCGLAGSMLAEGKGVTADLAQAEQLFQRACNGSDAPSCNALGEMLEKSTKNTIRSEPYYRRGCYRGHADACFNLGRVEHSRSADMAKRSFEFGCMRQSQLACATLKVMYGQNKVVIPPPELVARHTQACNGGSNRDCAIAGLLQAASNNPMAKGNLNRACMTGDKWACELQKNVK